MFIAQKYYTNIITNKKHHQQQPPASAATNDRLSPQPAACPMDAPENSDEKGTDSTDLNPVKLKLDLQLSVKWILL